MQIANRGILSQPVAQFCLGKLLSLKKSKDAAEPKVFESLGREISKARLHTESAAGVGTELGC